ncbi:MAG: YihA family ribosome biogenesis GTP-binding protein [Erysipelotrichaceae bacterium]|nr:YihA family ribosome biogenesis GTP-binding protein [Erysipelotrichaceae bacterium]
MEVKNSQLLTSAFHKEQWPQTDLPEWIMVGRSNVGKSSLINAMCNRKNLAYVGKTPGKTRLLNFFEVNHELILVDAPGYGYAQRNLQTHIDFGKMMEDYFHERLQCKGMLLILDIRRIPNEDDLLMYDFAKHYHVPVTVVLTKCDKLSRSDQNLQVKKICDTLGISGDSCALVSSEKKTGVEEVWNRMMR